MEKREITRKQLITVMYENKFCTITDRQFRTKKRTYQISKIEKTEVRRNLLMFFPICILAFIFTYKFWDYLYVDERIYFIVVPFIIGLISLSFGTLYVYSKALGEPALFGFIPLLKKVRTNLDDAMFALENTNGSEYINVIEEESINE